MVDEHAWGDFLTMSPEHTGGYITLITRTCSSCGAQLVIVQEGREGPYRPLYIPPCKSS